jgi:biopolymer transport protein ExbD
VASNLRVGSAITGINVTPLVDVTLVLLIIFMVTARLVARSQTIAVDLPKAASGQSIQEILSIELRADGKTAIDGAEVPDDAALVERALASVRRSREVRAVIQADGAVHHRRVVEVLDRLRGVGIVRVGFGVVPKAHVTRPERGP